MAEQPAPTYKVETVNEVTRYICVVEDASKPSGTCEFWARDEDLMRAHQEQRHSGSMVEDTSEQEAQEAEGGYEDDEGAEPAPSA